jgi:hypothetical protein
MQYKNYYASFLAIYDECYADIVKMMRNKGVTRLEIEEDEDYGYDRITIVNEYYGNSEDKEVAVVELVGDDLYFENENEYSYEVNRVVIGQNITDLYDIVYRALYETNN